MIPISNFSKELVYKSATASYNYAIKNPDQLDCILENAIESIVKNPNISYLFAFNFSHLINKKALTQLEDACCKTPKTAFLFARDIADADIYKLQQAVLKDDFYLSEFQKLNKSTSSIYE